MAMVTYKLTPPISTKLFKFNKFVSSLDLDLFLTNPDSLPCKCDNSPFADRHRKQVIYELLEIMFEENLLSKDLNIETLGL